MTSHIYPTAVRKMTIKAPNTENELGFALGEISPAILPGHSMMHLGNCNFTNVELLTL